LAQIITRRWPACPERNTQAGKFGQPRRRNAEKTKCRNRFELTKGRDLVVDPEPESAPINLLVYPLFEMNGQVIKPETTFEFRRIGS